MLLAPARTTVRPQLTLAVVSAATLLVMVAFCTITTTVTDSAAALGASLTGQTWALGGMSLGLAGALLTVGSLADTFGRRRVFIASSYGLAAACLLATVAPGVTFFVLARVLQGATGAGVLAAGLGLVGDTFRDGNARTRATGIWGASLAAGIATGPVLGASLSAVASWRWAHAVEALGAVMLAVAARSLPESATTARRIDLPGALTMTAAMISLTAALTAGRTGWTSPLTIGLLAAGAVLLGCFAWVETARREPMLDLRLLRRPRFVISIGGAAITGLATVALMSYSPVFLERGLGVTALAASGILAIWSLTSMATAMQAHRLPERLSSRTRLASGLAFSGVGAAALAGLSAESAWWRLIPGLLIAGVGSGLANAALARLAVESVPAGSAALGSGANNTARYLGSALGIAIVVAIATHGGEGAAPLVHGWNEAALIAGVLNAVGALVALTVGRD